MLIDACRAGKHVYCEKPLTLTIDEGKLIRKVVRETGKIVQIGSWAQSLNYGKGVAVSNAQTAVVKADKYARIVNTADLNGFYHYDPAAQLIIGERVALAVQSLLAAAPAAR